MKKLAIQSVEAVVLAAVGVGLGGYAICRVLKRLIRPHASMYAEREHR